MFPRETAVLLSAVVVVIILPLEKTLLLCPVCPEPHYKDQSSGEYKHQRFQQGSITLYHSTTQYNKLTRNRSKGIGGRLPPAAQPKISD